MKPIPRSLLLWSLGGLLLGGVWGCWGGVTDPPVSPPAGGSQTPALPRSPATAAPGTLAASGGSLGQMEKIAAASREELAGLTKEFLASEQDSTLLSMLWERWIDVDPAGGCDLLLGSEVTTPNRTHRIRDYLEKWSASDPDAALAWSLTLPRPADRNDSLSSIARGLAVSRPADFFHLLPKLGKETGITHHIETAARTLATTDPAALLKKLEGEDSTPGRKDEEKVALMKGLASGWAKKDAAAALDYVRIQQSGGLRNVGLAAIAGRVVTDNPELAAELLRESGETDSIKDAAAALARTNPDAALDWLAKNFPSESSDLSRELAWTSMPRSAAAAVDFMARHAEALFGAESSRFSTAIDWKIDDPKAALKAADSIADANTRSRIKIVLLQELARTAPQEALTSAQAVQVPDSAKEVLVRTAVRAWAMEDSAAASSWVARQPPGPARDPAIVGLAHSLSLVDPDSALLWAAAISSPEERTNQVTSLLQFSGLPEEKQIRTLEKLPLPQEDAAKIKRRLLDANSPR